ncbi:MAG: ABC transporter ATP-binding protein [Zoogloeaceae bacterium]|jgi:peptide/nickel transport system ATP-binding protein|nr:ABC transporter ATP-binding protein [Zoogloeaceae bacterium]
MSEPLLNVRDLTLGILRAGRLTPAVTGLSFEICAGETLALVGESGCGKSLSALALMRLLPAAIRIMGGEVRFQGQELLRLPETALRAKRGREMAMIFQEPATSLNAVLTVGQQIGEALARRGVKGEVARENAVTLLRQVGIADPARRLDEYPFQLSGGMKQRVMIAIALAGEPRLLIADEPTTALDVTVQSQILDLLAGLQAERGMALLLITHDLGIVARMAHRVGVMYAGQLVELSPRQTFFAAPQHPYSQALFAALPEAAPRGQRLRALAGQVPPFEAMPPACRFADRCERAEAKCREEAPELETPSPDKGRAGEGFAAVEQETMVKASGTLPNPPQSPLVRGDLGMAPLARCHFPGQISASFPVEATLPPESGSKTALLRVDNLKVHFPIHKGVLQRVCGQVRAVDGVSLRLMPGRTLALVGESGCGKTTVGKALMRLIPATEGQLVWQGERLFSDDKRQLRRLRRHMQMVFQDPFASLNPRMTVGEILLEGMLALATAQSEHAGRMACAALLTQVGLQADALDRYPHEFSGGQRQRIAIARALAVSPQALICDEPTSALDVSVQAQILNLLKDMQAELQVAYLFITHNFAVVEYLAHEVAVMYLGRVVEQGAVEAVLAAPMHPYTKALLSAVPRLEGQREIIRLEGETPSPANPPQGCHFHPRCPQAMPICRERYPETRTLAGERQVACHLAEL